MNGRKLCIVLHFVQRMLQPFVPQLVCLSLVYQFDFLLHLVLDRKVLNKWSALAVDILSSHPDITKMFVCDLAIGTHVMCKTGSGFTLWNALMKQGIIQHIFTSTIHIQLENLIKEPNCCCYQKEWGSSEGKKDVNKTLLFITPLLGVTVIQKIMS